MYIKITFEDGFVIERLITGAFTTYRFETAISTHGKIVDLVFET